MWAFEEIGGRNELDELRRVADTDPDPNVKIQAERSFLRLRSRLEREETGGSDSA